MYTLYHYPICPFSRKVRIAMNEKGLKYKLAECEFWKQDKALMRMNPMLTVPFLISSSGLKLVGSQPIVEYLEELDQRGESDLFPSSPELRAEVRRLVMWFDEKFFQDVVKHILNEKIFKFFRSGQHANQKILSFARKQLPYHLKYLDLFLSKRHYLAGNFLTIADIAVASQISSLDYLGEVNWKSYGILKDWYSLVKSRRSFSDILLDRISGFKPAPWYEKLDF